MSGLVFLLVLFVVPAAILLAGSEIMDRHALTARGVNVVAGGVFAGLALVGLVLVTVSGAYLP